MEINLREERDIAILDIKGEIRRIDFGPDSALHTVVKEQLDDDRRKIILNLEGVEFIDSFGIGEILASHISTQNVGGQLKLCNISKKLFIVFQVTMLVKVLNIYDDLESALSNFSSM